MDDNKDIITTGHGPSLPATTTPNPFARSALPSHINAGTVAIEEARAVAEAQGKLVIAKRFPRDSAKAFASIMEVCKRPGLAAIAEYSFPRGTERVTGPSIRLAEELARCWGNIDYGIRELSRKDGVSEMEAYAWDMETNTISSQKFTVRHVRDTRQGQKALNDERDIYELTANMAGRRLRARIMAIMPADIVDAAVHECRKTLAGDNTVPLVDRVRKMVQAFDKLGVTTAMLERRLGHTLSEVLPEEFAELTSIHNGIRDGMSKAGDWFAAADAPQQAAVADINSHIREAATAVPAQTQAKPAAETTPAKPVETTPAKPAEKTAAPVAAKPTDAAPAQQAAQGNNNPANGAPKEQTRNGDFF